MNDQGTTRPQEPAPWAPDFPIVGIGASAGGLDAFQRFFSHMPSDSGLAFVVVQHLAREHESLLPELLARHTEMEVHEAREGIEIEPNHVYVIPPNRLMTITDGLLSVEECPVERGHPITIDLFFRSLARELGERCVGIVLSGTGTEGARGIKEVKGVGGLTLVQDPETAKFPGMPLNAIGTGIVDYVLPPEEMPQHLLFYVERALPTKRREPLAFEGESDRLLKRIFELVEVETGHDFSDYKATSTRRRIERRMAVNQITGLDEYVRYLERTPAEVRTLFREFLIGVTHFFRDPEAFEALEEQVIPKIFQGHAPDDPIRVWVAGCSTGEEAYSIAILLQEQMERVGREYSVQLFASDIDAKAVAVARRGVYSNSIAADVTAERLERFFFEQDESYEVRPQIRSMIIFTEQSFVKDPPFSRLDLISCRNVLIYLNSELQRRVIPLFHYALRPGGYLFLGTADGLARQSELFKVVDQKWNIVRAADNQRQRGTPGRRGFALPPLIGETRRPPRTRVRDDAPVQDYLLSFLLEHYTPPGVLVNEEGRVLYFHGRTGKYLEPPAGEAALDLLPMAREGLRIPLTAALHRVLHHRKEIVYERVRVQMNDHEQLVRLIVRPLEEYEALGGLTLVLFEDVEKSGDFTGEVIDATDARVRELENEVASTREYLQTTIEELEVTNEELQSSNEELHSSNEELQSTNEELDTAKEELQSVNEELMTVNTEMQEKNEALKAANTAFRSIFAGSRLAVIFLDSELEILRFSTRAQELINLRESDVGRPLVDLSTKLPAENVVADAQRIRDTLETIEREVQTEEGLWYWMRLQPYRLSDNAVAGVVITFAEITEQKNLQAERRTLQRAVEQSSTLVGILTPDRHFSYVNPTFATTLGHPRKALMEGPLSLLQSGFVDPPAYQVLRQALERGVSSEQRVHYRRPDGELLWLRLDATPVRAESEDLTHFLLMGEDITERRQREAQLRLHSAALDAVRQAVVLSDAERRVLYLNRAAGELFGFSQAEAEGLPFYKLWQGLKVEPDLEIVLERLDQGESTWEEERVEIGPEGERRQVDLSLRILEDDAVELFAVIVVIEEMTG
ncbi:MAG: chemotaxis protein CheB [Anaerolineales bacterium]